MDPKKLSQGERESHDMYDLGDFNLVSGETLPKARIAYKAWGTLNADKSNAIVYPTWFTGRHWENDWLIGPAMTLSPEKYFIIVPNMFGNGLSSSPSNTPPPLDGPRFPKIAVQDNVNAQHRLVTEKFGITSLVAVLGWSMGAGQTFQWAVSYPEMVPKILPFCGSARTSPHNRVFLEGVKAALTADAKFKGGDYLPADPPSVGLKACARVYAGWGLSQPFYWHETWKEMGFKSLEDFLVNFWEKFFLAREPNNLLCMLSTWWNGNIGNTEGFDGNLETALASIKAKAIVMPALIDLYFPVADEEYEVSHMPNAELRVIPGVWGHFAGGGACSTDTAFIDQGLRDLLDA